MMIYAIHRPFADKLELVKNEMLRRGAPVLRVVNCGDHYMALEGSHRLAAAHDIGIKPELVIFEQDDDIEISGYDWFDAANWSGTIYPAGEVAGELYSVQAQGYRF